MIGYTITGKKFPNRVLARQEANPPGHRFKLGCVMTTMGVQEGEGDLKNQGRGPIVRVHREVLAVRAVHPDLL
jgi:hypothetical protein